MDTVIGVTPHLTDERKYYLNPAYLENINQCGASTVILPYEVQSVPAYMNLISGLLLTGGGDVCPKNFNQEPHEKTNPPCLERDEFELAVCREAYKRGIPILGICRGVQLLNVALGGDLIQHHEGHSFEGDKRKSYVHAVKLAKGSMFHGIIGSDEIEVNSIHHQAVGAVLGEGVKICALSNDGLTEAIEGISKKFVLGVQWHPEELNDKNTKAIFSAFVDACKGGNRRRTTSGNR